jgi:uncharacterized protein YcbX
VRVAELWRYPVKSLQGERLTGGEVGPEGLAGDRQWALFDTASGFGLTARRVPDLLFLTGRLRPDGSAEIVVPDGSVTSDDAVLSDWLGRPVALRAAGDATGPRRYENPDAAESEDSWRVFEGSAQAFHDSIPVTLLSAATVGARPVRRFRPNVVLDGGDEDALLGAVVQIGAATVAVTKPVARCVMVTRSQPDGIGIDREVLRWIHRERGGVLSVGGAVVHEGAVRVGDEVRPVRRA